MTRRRRWWLAVTGAAAVVAGVALVVGRGRPDVTTLRAEDVVSVEVRPRYWEDPTQAPGPIQSSDPEAIAGVLDALRPTEPVRPHGCVDRGELIIVRRSGREIRLYFLPGHNEEYYEYRGPNGWVRVDRPKFLAAMRQLGATWVPEECK